MYIFWFVSTAPIPYPEDSVTATRLTGTTINVQWDILSLHDAGGYVTGYDIAWTVSGTTSTNKTTVSPDTTEYTINQYVYVENAYNIKVGASTSAGYGMYSKAVFVNSESYCDCTNVCSYSQSPTCIYFRVIVI